MPHAKTGKVHHVNGSQPHTIHILPLSQDTRPQLTLRQRLTCRHYQQNPVYATTWGPDGEWGQHLIHYECACCGRKLRNPYQRQPSLYPALICLGLALMLLAWWFLYAR